MPCLSNSLFKVANVYYQVTMEVNKATKEQTQPKPYNGEKEDGGGSGGGGDDGKPLFFLCAI